jgi:FkbM family methyltransferase
MITPFERARHPMKFLNKANKYSAKIVDRLFEKTNKKDSYAQCGEDLIIKFIFDSIGIEKPSYIDIGAHHPEYLSNTALFYKTGSTGINIEPDPKLFQGFSTQRERDINLQIGISDKEGILDLYVMSVPALNTFSKYEAENLLLGGKYSVESIQSIPVDTISSVIQKYYDNKFPDLMSLDVEGLDELILRSIEYESSCPTVICVETISFSENGRGLKNTSIINFLTAQGYMVYADTYINTIFLRQEKWAR